MTTEGNLEVVWKTEVLNTTFASSQRLFQNLCMHQHAWKGEQQTMWGGNSLWLLQEAKGVQIQGATWSLSKVVEQTHCCDCHSTVTDIG